MLKRTQLFISCIIIGAPLSLAHPVSFEDGWSFMAFNQSDMYDWQLLYTFKPNLSLGVDFIRDNMELQERYFLIPRLSWLVKRWNETESQANIYVYGGVGAARKGSFSNPAIEGAIEADYETRAVYFSSKAQIVAAQDFNTLATYQLRAGFAPYLGESGELHSWLIGQVQYLPFAAEQSLRVGPVLRMFYKNVLWEFGVSTKGSWNFNFMVHW